MTSKMLYFCKIYSCLYIHTGTRLNEKQKKCCKQCSTWIKKVHKIISKWI